MGSTPTASTHWLAVTRPCGLPFARGAAVSVSAVEAVMGKKKKRRLDQINTFSASMTAGGPSDGEVEGEGDDAAFGGLEASEIASAIRVVTMLGKRPDLFSSKMFKPLRAALDPLVQLQMKKYDPVDYAARVTTALQHKRGHDALLALQGMRAHGQVARQGTVQRWVRDCDAVPNEGGLRVRLLQAVLRASTPVDLGEAAGEPEGPLELPVVQGGPAADAAGASAEGADVAVDDDAPAGVEQGDDDGSGASVIEHPEWDPAAQEEGGCAQKATEVCVRSGGMADVRQLTLRTVMMEAAAERQPPNHYDLRIWACLPGEVSLSTEERARARVRRVDVPHVSYVWAGAGWVCGARAGWV